MKITILNGGIVLVLMAGLMGEASIGWGAGVSLSSSTIDGGGGSRSVGITPEGGQKFAMLGLVGQPEAGGSTAGTYVQQGGFVPGLIKSAGPPLNIMRAGNEFTFTWPNLSAGFVLEASSSVDGPVWTLLGSGTVIGPNRQVIVFSPTTPAFFRLRKDCPASCSSHCPQ